jgi:hypothetical protein
MSTPVPCPKCGLVLKAPPGSAGRKARCKKCNEKFRIPGEPAAEAPIVLDESIALSSFDFSAPSAPAAEAAAPAEVPVGSNPFAVPAAVSSPAAAKRSSRMGGVAPKKPTSGKGPLIIAGIVGGLFVVLCALGAGVWFWRERADKEAIAKAAVVEVNQKRKADEKAAIAATEAAKAKDQAHRDKGPADEPKKRVDLTAIPPPKAKPSPVPAAVLTAPPPPGGDVKPVTAAPLIVPVPFDPVTVETVLVNPFPTRLAVVRKTFQGFQGTGAIRTVDTFTYPAMAKLATVEVPSDIGPSPIALGTGDGWLVAETAPGKVSVWNSSNGTKLKSDVELFAQPSTVKSTTIAQVVAVEESLVAMSSDGTVVRLGKDDKPTVAFKPDKQLGPGYAVIPDVTATIADDGKVACYGVGDGVLVASLTSGNAKVEWNVAMKAPEWKALALDAAGTRIACVVKPANGAARCVVGRLGGTTPIVNAPIVGGVGEPNGARWYDNVVLVTTTDGTHIIYDTERGYVGVIRTPGTPTKRQRPLPGGERWLCVAQDPANKMQFRVFDLPFPFDGYYPLRDRTIDAKKVISLSHSDMGLMGSAQSE